MIDGSRLECPFLLTTERGLWLGMAGRDRLFVEIVPGVHTDDSTGGGHIAAAMHGVVQSVQVAAGDEVMQGQTLLVLEAMKMQQAVSAPFDGTVTEIRAREGQQVSTGDLLLELSPAEIDS